MANEKLCRKVTDADGVVRVRPEHGEQRLGRRINQNLFKYAVGDGVLQEEGYPSCDRPDTRTYRYFDITVKDGDATKILIGDGGAVVDGILVGNPVYDNTYFYQIDMTDKLNIGSDKKYGIFVRPHQITIEETDDDADIDDYRHGCVEYQVIDVTGEDVVTRREAKILAGSITIPTSTSALTADMIDNSVQNYLEQRDDIVDELKSVPVYDGRGVTANSRAILDTNFKMDTLLDYTANAGSNMYIDVFNDATGIDNVLSADYRVADGYVKQVSGLSYEEDYSMVDWAATHNSAGTGWETDENVRWIKGYWVNYMPSSYDPVYFGPASRGYHYGYHWVDPALTANYEKGAAINFRAKFDVDRSRQGIVQKAINMRVDNTYWKAIYALLYYNAQSDNRMGLRVQARDLSGNLFVKNAYVSFDDLEVMADYDVHVDLENGTVAMYRDGALLNSDSFLTYDQIQLDNKSGDGIYTDRPNNNDNVILYWKFGRSYNFKERNLTGATVEAVKMSYDNAFGTTSGPATVISNTVSLSGETDVMIKAQEIVPTGSIAYELVDTGGTKIMDLTKDQYETVPSGVLNDVKIKTSLSDGQELDAWGIIAK